VILGIGELMKLVKEINLVENLSSVVAADPEGTGLDVRLGEVHSIEGDGFIGADDEKTKIRGERQTPKSTLLAKYGRDREFVLTPGAYVVVKTVERVNLPANLMMHSFPRSTLQRSGVLLLCTKTDPGYVGELSFGMKNLGSANFRLELGARIANVVFEEVKGETVAYRGQWKGGRVTTQGRERQV
jgi:deoxycytidine triphosphate deaminase